MQGTNATYISRLEHQFRKAPGLTLATEQVTKQYCWPIISNRQSLYGLLHIPTESWTGNVLSMLNIERQLTVNDQTVYAGIVIQFTIVARKNYPIVKC